ncbi:hypothetical protein C0Q70_19684 [Pomacea canaliculata]|uniref:Uncharacterized protein n=1 Tax=Pomacea canaliculata TaxID=400727 RepID=A0A2T7NDF2_POMCA|nr:hypothetical protein C0Q70_19684 [Pomacea canaliculata]
MLARNQTVTVGMCSYTCHLMIPFIVTQALAIGLSSACVTPIYVTVLRSVAEADKTLALGLLAFVISLVGEYVTGVCQKECGRAGSCDVYDVTTLRRRYIGLQVGASLLGNALLAAALLILTWQVRTHRTEDTVDDGISDSVRKAKKDDGDDVTDSVTGVGGAGVTGVGGAGVTGVGGAGVTGVGGAGVTGVGGGGVTGVGGAGVTGVGGAGVTGVGGAGVTGVGGAGVTGVGGAGVTGVGVTGVGGAGATGVGVTGVGGAGVTGV